MKLHTWALEGPQGRGTFRQCATCKVIQVGDALWLDAGGAETSDASLAMRCPGWFGPRVQVPAVGAATSLVSPFANGVRKGVDEAKARQREKEAA